jgi:hypothetical protein
MTKRPDKLERGSFPVACTINICYRKFYDRKFYDRKFYDRKLRLSLERNYDCMIVILAMAS